MKKGQGSLEYLIMVAAVLAIAAVVVLFMTGAFKTSTKSASLAKCEEAFAQCQQKRAIAPTFDCTSICTAGCSDIGNSKSGCTLGSTMVVACNNTTATQASFLNCEP
ncbi:MAG: class III signal peptide-containing protein [archaeon]